MTIIGKVECNNRKDKDRCHKRILEKEKKIYVNTKNKDILVAVLKMAKNLHEWKLMTNIAVTH